MSVVIDEHSHLRRTEQSFFGRQCPVRREITMLSQLYTDEVIGTLVILHVVSRTFVSATYGSYNAINRKHKERERERERDRERERESKGESDGERWREGD